MNRRQSTGAHYVVSSIVLVFSRAMVTVGGFAVVVLLAAKFGATAKADAYFIARLIPVTLLSPLGIAFNLAFVPVYMQTRADATAGVQAAAQLAGSFLGATLIVSALLTILYIAFAHSIVAALAPGFSPETREAGVWMTRIMAPAVLLTSVHALFDSVLNAQRRFIASALTSLLVPAGALLGITVMADRWGVTGLAAGTLAGFVAQAAILAPFVRRQFSGWTWPALRPRTVVSPAMRDLGLAILVVAGIQVNTAVDRLFGSLLGEGAVSALSLGTVVVGLVPILLAAPIYKVLYPELVQRVQEGRRAELRRILRDNFIVVAFAAFPVTVGLMLFAPLITELAFNYGRFDAAAVSRTSQVIFYGAIGLPTGVAGLLLFYFFLLTRNAGLIVKIFIASITANAVLDWVLMTLMGIGGIALGSSLMTVLRTGVMAIVAGRLLGGSVVAGLALPFAKLTGATAAATAVMYALAQAFQTPLQQGSPLALLAVALAVVSAGATVYVLVAVWLRSEPSVWLGGLLRQRKQAGKSEDSGR